MVADEENLTSYNCYSVPKYARLGLGFKDLLILSRINILFLQLGMVRGCESSLKLDSHQGIIGVFLLHCINPLLIGGLK